MDKDKKIVIPGITGLSKVILETLGEIRKSDNVLNSATFSQFLARKQMVKDLIKLAKEGQEKSIKSRKKAELKKTLQSLDSTDEKKEKNILTQMVEIQAQLDDEKDFSKRVSLILLNLCRFPGNESLYEFLDEYKQLVIDDADIKKREKNITEIKNRMLKGVAQCTSELLRKTDVFARYGGEEFIILLPQTDLQQSLIVARKLREIAEDTEFLYEDAKVPITVSVGITEVNSADIEFKTIFNRVDSYMYRAKRGGRNTVVSDLEMNVSVDDAHMI